MPFFPVIFTLFVVILSEKAVSSSTLLAIQFRSVLSLLKLKSFIWAVANSFAGQQLKKLNMEAWLDMRIIRIPRPKLVSVISAASAVSAVSAVASSVASSVVGNPGSGSAAGRVLVEAAAASAASTANNDHDHHLVDSPVGNHHHHLHHHHRMNGGGAIIMAESEADSCSN